MKFRDFIKECHHKEVFKMLSIYIVSSWILLQVTSVTWQALGLPQNSLTFLILLLLVGFPLYIFFVWKLFLEPKKINHAKLENGARYFTSGFQQTYFSILGVISTICIVGIFLIIGKLFSKTKETAIFIESDKIAVLKFGNNTGDPKYDIISKMAADWIIHGITENHLAEVISPEVITDYNAIFKGNKSDRNQEVSLLKRLQPAKIISGNFYLSQGRMVFQSTITDGKTNEILISFETKPCNVENSISCIKDIEESITGFLATLGHKELMLQEDPPKYEAYKYLLEAKGSGSDQEYLDFLNKSLAADPDYFEPKVLRVGYYYNIHDYKTADSLLKLIKPDTYNNKRQLNLLTMYKAILDGNNKKVYETMLKEYDIAPFDLQSNKTAMVIALQYVNQPEDVENIFNIAKMDSMDFQNCMDCVQRVYVKAMADVQLKNYSSAIDIVQKVLDETDADLIKTPLIAAFVRSGEVEKLNKFLERSEFSNTSEQLQQLYLTTGEEYLLKQDTIKANVYLDKAKQLYTLTSNKENLAKVFLELGDYVNARKEYAILHKSLPKNIDYLGKLAISNYKTGHKTEAEKNLQALEKLRSGYLFGEIYYIFAQYNAIANDEEAMYHNLFKAVASGYLFKARTYQNDPIFIKYANTDRFQDILNYWH